MVDYLWKFLAFICNNDRIFRIVIWGLGLMNVEVFILCLIKGGHIQL